MGRDNLTFTILILHLPKYVPELWILYLSIDEYSHGGFTHISSTDMIVPSIVVWNMLCHNDVTNVTLQISPLSPEW
jgi:hypothetical protein